MAHREQKIACEKFRGLINSPESKSYFEIGSCDVNGSCRKIFGSREFLGVDLIHGPNVDIVASGHTVVLDKQYDCALSFECFEHNPHWVDTLINMLKYTKDGGFIFLSFATNGRLEHGTDRTDPRMSPGTSQLGWNYYKNISKKEFKEVFSKIDKLSDIFIYQQNFTHDIYVCIKKNNKFENNQIKYLKNNFRFYIFMPKSIVDLAKIMSMLPLKILFLILGDCEKYQKIGIVYSIFLKKIQTKINFL